MLTIVTSGKPHSLKVYLKKMTAPACSLLKVAANMWVLFIIVSSITPVMDVGQHNQSSSRITTHITNIKNYSVSSQEFDSKEKCTNAALKFNKISSNFNAFCIKNKD
jgi:hypothetical protein